VGNITDEDIAKEVDIINQICTTGHENIVQIIRHNWSRSGPNYFIDMELCTLNLYDYIYHTQEYSRCASALSNQPTFAKEDSSVHLKLINIWTIIDHIAEGLKFMHDKRHIHRDLKPLNSNFNCVTLPTDITSTVFKS
jgi:serine/threonine protein kinase